jgi:polyphenol oxidase
MREISVTSSPRPINVMNQILPQPGEHFSWIPAASAGPAGPVLQCGPLAAIAPHFFTTRALRLRADSPEAAEHWAAVASTIGVPPSQLRKMHQVHGCTTVTAASEKPMESPEADGVMTDERGVALVVRVADCVPLLMADPRTGAVAAVHAGWRGTAAGIAAAAVRRLQQQYGSKPEDIVAAIGPSIGACCYQVGPEVRAAFSSMQTPTSTSTPTVTPVDVDAWFTPDPHRGDRLRFDGCAANRDQLIAAGLNPANVHVARLCTMTHLSHFYSYRAEGAGTGRLLGVIRRAG